MMRTSLMIVALFLFLPHVTLAQAEHVEVTHPVYEFLNRMQLRGLTPGYSRAMLPLERKAVTAFIRSLSDADESATAAKLTGAESTLLARFEEEFVAEADGMQQATVLFDTPVADVVSASLDDREKYLYRWRSEDGSSTFHMELLASLEYRALMDDDRKTNVTLGQLGGRFRGTLGGVFGYGLMATNGTAKGDRALAMSDHQLRRNFNFADLDKDFFDFSEAYVTASWDWGAVALGREKRLIGSGYGNKFLISTNAQPFDAVQFTAHAGDVRFLFLHGFLLSEKEFVDNYRPYYDSKYLAIHRLEADLFDALRFGVFESVIYSQREIDFGYLNPVNFYKSAEHAGGDRDNPMLGFDLATLFVPGSQLYGSWLIDDVDFARWGDDWWGNKFIWQGGIANASLLPNTDVTLEYTRIEPYVYSHRLAGNQYTHNGDALGLELPPNSDEWYVAMRHWLSADLWMTLEVHRRRHGRNEVDEDGNVLVNHGADIYESLAYQRDSDIAAFLDGPLDESLMFTLGARYEPIRNFVFHARWRFRSLTSEVDGERKDHFFLLGLGVEY